MSVVIVEGPDGAGKTTLIDTLAPALKAMRFHNGAFLGEKWIGHHYRRQLYRALLRPSRSLVIDRAWFAEPIYGRAMRGGANRVPAWERRGLERLALRTGAVVVRCLPEFDVCRRAWAARVVEGKEYLDKEAKLKAVHAGYAKLDPGPLPMLTYDYTHNEPRDVLTWIKKQPSPPTVTRAPGLGRFAPRRVVALVGEAMNSHHVLDLPFVSEKRGGSGPWIAQQLEDWGISEGSLYWVNAYFAGQPQQLSFLRLLKPLKVVALGAIADERLRLLRVDHEVVPHPQYWKRFHFNEPYPLREHLECITSH